MQDYVGRFIELRNQKNKIEEELSALELIILQEHRDDERLTIVSGRKTFSITDKGYSALETLGNDVTIIEVRNKKLEEFDVELRALILSKPSFYEEKVSKESIRVKKDGKQ